MLDDLQKYHEDIPGPISIISKENGHPPSLFHNVWQFNHDPDDQFIREIISERQRKFSSVRSQGIDKSYHDRSSGANLEGSKKQYGLNLLRHQSLSYDSFEQRYQKLRDYKFNRPRFIQDQSKQNEPNQINQLQNSLWNKYIEQPHLQKSVQAPVNPHEQIYEQIQQKPTLRKVESQQKLCCSNRNFEIFSHKIVSNLNLEIWQTRELVFWNQIQILQSDIEEHRKNIMKKEIQCRKLRISLRNYQSTSCLMKLKNKDSLGKIKSPEKQKNTRQRSQKQLNKFYNRLDQNSKSKKRQKIVQGTFGSKTPLPKKTHKKEKELLDQINLFKDRSSKLAARESLISNRFRVLKSKIQNQFDYFDQKQATFLGKKQFSLIPNSILPPQSKIVGNSLSLRNGININAENREQVELLLKKYKILTVSVNESKSHFEFKARQLIEQIRIMKQELQIIESKIYMGMDGNTITKIRQKNRTQSFQKSKNGAFFLKSPKMCSSKDLSNKNQDHSTSTSQINKFKSRIHMRHNTQINQSIESANKKRKSSYSYLMNNQFQNSFQEEEGLQSECTNYKRETTNNESPSSNRQNQYFTENRGGASDENGS